MRRKVFLSTEHQYCMERQIELLRSQYKVDHWHIFAVIYLQLPLRE